MINDVTSRSAGQKPHKSISAEEMRTATLASHGLDSGEIAKREFVCERTIKARLATVGNKLGVTGRVAITRWVVEQELRPAMCREMIGYLRITINGMSAADAIRRDAFEEVCALLEARAAANEPVEPKPVPASAAHLVDINDLAKLANRVATLEVQVEGRVASTTGPRIATALVNARMDVVDLAAQTQARAQQVAADLAHTRRELVAMARENEERAHHDAEVIAQLRKQVDAQTPKRREAKRGR